MTTGIILLIQTYDDEESATRAMQAYARQLRRRRMTKRYGVFIEKRASTWWLNLVDRQA